MIYKIFKNLITNQAFGVIFNNNISIPFDPANTDYANFKRQINEGTPQLQDADGNLMTAEQAKQFVKELP